MNRDEPDISNPPHNFFQMLNSLIRNDNILLRTEIENINEDSNRGCSEEFINSLEEKTIDDEILKKGLQCSICLDEFKQGDKYTVLPCNEDSHYFHSGCETCSGIKEWLKRKNTCPMCRTEFPKDEQNNNLENILNDHNIIFETLTFHIQSPIINNREEENREEENREEEEENREEHQNIVNINPNNLINRMDNIIRDYVNEIQETNEQRELQMAIEASLNDT